MTAPSVVVARLFALPVTSTLVVWAVLLGLALVALFGLAALGRRHTPARARLSIEDYARLVEEARELVRHAAAITERTRAAAADLARAQALQTEAQQARDAAGREFDEAQRAYQEALALWRAHTAQRAARVRTPEDEELEREVAKAALGAFRRGDVSADQLREVFRRTGGWDPVQEQLESEIARLRAEAHQRHRAYDAAVVAERMADNAASVAEVATQALAEEATEAAEEARAARAAAQEYLRALRRRRFWFGTGRLRSTPTSDMRPHELPFR